MAIAQLSQSIIPKAVKETVFSSQITNVQESLIMVKKLFATSISCITYLRGLFPESSYRERCLDGFNIKILQKDQTCPGSQYVIKWIKGCFDALEKKYLHMAVLKIYTNPKEAEKVTEMYQFKFRYAKEGATMDFGSSNTSFESGIHNDSPRKASILLIRKLYMMMQNLGPLPNDVILTMNLHYYNAVTPCDYQPPGFKEGVNSHILIFEGQPLHLQVGEFSTGYHNIKVKVITTATRVRDFKRHRFQEISTAKIAHQGLECDEEEEECNNNVRKIFIKSS
ncbi:HORMA domain-containing protein 2 [Suncus etruscus]|uniref:HORMA domain-containing protein 2 n=1 Tax=Suncus etruscus TaxID=109475 RepID=UPI00210FCD28|nr:HORMA domain-containing protein 2 [Suncus etruscus]